jgi:hypothetical protein
MRPVRKLARLQSRQSLRFGFAAGLCGGVLLAFAAALRDFSRRSRRTQLEAAAAANSAE